MLRQLLLLLRNQPAQRIHLTPVGKFGADAHIGRAIRELHDQTDDLPVKPAAARVINLARKNGHMVRLPGRLAQQLAHIGVGLRGLLARLAPYCAD